jgi:flagellum-specific ATP synthase
LRSGGAITAIMTVLSETDTGDDPISEMMKSLLDGHIMLSRTLAEQGVFPAIDICRSVSRQADGLVTPEASARARRVVEWLSQYESSRTLRESGLYSAGSDPGIDGAIERNPSIIGFLKQDRRERVPLAGTQSRLAELVGAYM